MPFVIDLLVLVCNLRTAPNGQAGTIRWVEEMLVLNILLVP